MFLTRSCWQPVCGTVLIRPSFNSGHPWLLVCPRRPPGYSTTWSVVITQTKYTRGTIQVWFVWWHGYPLNHWCLRFKSPGVLTPSGPHFNCARPYVQIRPLISPRMKNRLSRFNPRPVTLSKSIYRSNRSSILLHLDFLRHTSINRLCVPSRSRPPTLHFDPSITSLLHLDSRHRWPASKLYLIFFVNLFIYILYLLVLIILCWCGVLVSESSGLCYPIN